MLCKRGKTNDFLKSEIQKIEKRLRKNGTPITSGKVTAEQILGFWTDLFEVHHYKLLKGKPIKIFVSLSSGFGRKEVNDELEKVVIESITMSLFVLSTITLIFPRLLMLIIRLLTY